MCECIEAKRSCLSVNILSSLSSSFQAAPDDIYGERFLKAKKETKKLFSELLEDDLEYCRKLASAAGWEPS